MKIVFFKNEAHFHPRISYVWENAENVELGSKSPNLKRFFMWMLVIPFFVFVIVYGQELTSKRLLLLTSSLLCLPIHEFCHALFCWISGRKVERIHFFPYKQVLSNITAYVKPAFGVWKKHQIILFFSFPIIMLSIIPAILAIFITPLRLWLVSFSLLNIAVSYSDIIDIFYLIKSPKKSLHFIDFTLITKDADKPVIIHQLSVTPKLDKIHHKCFEYYNGKLTTKEPPAETVEIRKIKQEFINQFHLKMTQQEREQLATSYLGKIVTIEIDRPIGTIHPKHSDLVYPINYGYIPGVLGGDGEELDVYLLGVDTPKETYTAQIIGIVYRRNDVEDKLVAAPVGVKYTKEEIADAVHFQEQYYESYIATEE